MQCPFPRGTASRLPYDSRCGRIGISGLSREESLPQSWMTASIRKCYIPRSYTMYEKYLRGTRGDLSVISYFGRCFRVMGGLDALYSSGAHPSKLHQRCMLVRGETVHHIGVCTSRSTYIIRKSSYTASAIFEAPWDHLRRVWADPAPRFSNNLSNKYLPPPCRYPSGRIRAV